MYQSNIKQKGVQRVIATIIVLRVPSSWEVLSAITLAPAWKKKGTLASKIAMRMDTKLL